MKVYSRVLKSVVRLGDKIPTYLCRWCDYKHQPKIKLPKLCPNCGSVGNWKAVKDEKG